jgi:hypothetical protein
MDILMNGLNKYSMVYHGECGKPKKTSQFSMAISGT